MSGFVSGLAAPLQSLLEVKHAIGLPYVNSESHLRRFDKMCAETYPGEVSLTKEMAMAWAVARPAEHVNGQMRRITPIRQLAKHMGALGLAAFVIPSGIPGKQIRYRPHIYSHAQLRSLFNAADNLQTTRYGGRREVIIPVIFRIIYCLGLRPSEARTLRCNDVDLVRGTVSIRQSKGHKDRIVYMSSDLHEYCRTYDATISAHYPDRMPFFPNRYGNFYSQCTIDYWFQQLLAAAAPHIVSSAGSPPRVYDLRHAHVVENINRWVLAGKDPEALVAYLSLHLGHANTEDTWYYFHLAADFHVDLRRIANTSIESDLLEASDGLR